MELKDYNNKHAGETIFILGNGEELNTITEEQRKVLDKHTTIGVNYAHVIYTPTYLISGHFSHILYAQNFADIDNIDRVFYQGNRDNIDDFKEDLRKFTLVNIKYYFNKLSLKVLKEVNDTENYLVGASNISLSSSNLAYLMGAKRIVYIGFNQRNRLHFYDVDEDMKKMLSDNIDVVKSKYDSPRMKEVNNDFKMFLEHMLPPEVLRQKHFFKPDIGAALRTLFNTFITNGVEVISTEEDSKLVDSGAKYMSFDELIEIIKNEDNS